MLEVDVGQSSINRSGPLVDWQSCWSIDGYPCVLVGRLLECRCSTSRCLWIAKFPVRMFTAAFNLFSSCIAWGGCGNCLRFEWSLPLAMPLESFHDSHEFLVSHSAMLRFFRKKGFGGQYLSLGNTCYWPKIKYCVWTANLEPSLRGRASLERRRTFS